MLLKEQKAELLRQVDAAIKAAPDYHDVAPEGYGEWSARFNHVWGLLTRCTRPGKACNKVEGLSDRLIVKRTRLRALLRAEYYRLEYAMYDLWPLCTFSVDGGLTYRVFNSKSALGVFKKGLGDYPVSVPAATDNRLSIPAPTRAPSVPSKRPESAALIKLLDHALSKDKTRPELGVVLRLVAGEVGATDGRRVSVVCGVDSEPIKDARNYSGPIPGYKAGELPHAIPGDGFIEIDIDDAAGLWGKCQQALKCLGEKSSVSVVLTVFQMKDGRVEIGGTGLIPPGGGEQDKDYGYYESAMVCHGTPIVTLQAGYLQDALGFLLRAGNACVKMRYDGNFLLMLLGKHEYSVIAKHSETYVPGWRGPRRRQPVV